MEILLIDAKGSDKSQPKLLSGCPKNAPLLSICKKVKKKHTKPF